MINVWRRVAAAVVVLVIVGLIAGDQWDAALRGWWDRHTLTASVVTNLLVLAVAGLIVDEVVARRQRQQRSVSVAVQGLIVYGQARRAYEVLTAPSDASGAGAPEELRTLASMLLTASSSLFDDPVARKFLEGVERLTASMVRMASPSPKGGSNKDGHERLTAAMAQVRTDVGPLLARIPAEDRSVLEGPPEV
jgi:hypothetical protein